MAQTHDFIHQLWGDSLVRGAVQIWHRRDKKTHLYVNLSAAADSASHVTDEDVYIAAGLAPKSMKPSRRRTPAAEVVAIPGVWMDIDVNGGPENKSGAAPDRDAALELAETIIAPTVLVNSGYGIQAWWLFEDPWYFGSEDEQQQAAKLVAAFQLAMRAKAHQRGFTMDATHDLARLMRLPGTVNCKGAENGSIVPVKIIEGDGTRYTVVEISQTSESYMTEARNTLRRSTGEGIEISVQHDAVPPTAKLDNALELSDEFRNSWRHIPGNREKRMWSMSEWEMSITHHLVNFGWTDQEIADTLVYHRLKWDAQGAPAKNRPGRIALTIGKVRDRQESAEREAEAEYDREEALTEIVEVASADGPPDPVRTISLFSRLMNGPPVKELIQDGRDPETARFRVILADGQEVIIGKIDDLMELRRFRKVFASQTGVVLPTIKPNKWDQVVQALLHAATVNEDQEDTRVARTLELIQTYLEHNGVGKERDASCFSQQPWAENGHLHLHAGHLHQWLRRARGDRIDISDLVLNLKVCGFERKTINYQRPREGGKSSRSYYRIDSEAMAA